MKIIWIDDIPEEMQNVITYVIASLWKSKIPSKIYIMRDTANCEETTDQKIAIINELVLSTFTDFLISENYIDNETVSKEWYSLIHEPKNDSVLEDSFSPTSNVLVNKINDFKKLYSSLNGSQNDISEEYLKSFFDYQNEKPIIMIDMCLYSKDYDKLKNKSNEVIFSMSLYNFLKNKGYKTYMYTSYLYPNNLIEYWQEIYKKEFESNEEGIVKIKFFGRDGKCVDDQEITLAKELGVENND